MESFGIRRANVEDLRGGEAQLNAGIIRRILEGSEGAGRDIAVLNAGAALTVAGIARDLNEGVALSRDAISGGAALKKLNLWKEATHS